MTPEDRSKYEVFLVDLRAVLSRHNATIEGDYVNVTIEGASCNYYSEGDSFTSSTTVDDLY